MPVERLNIEIDQNGVFNPVYQWLDDNENPLNIENYEGTMQIRESRKSSAPLIWEGNTSQGGLSLIGGSGQILPYIESDITKDFDFDWAYYDIQLHPTGTPDHGRLIIGGHVKLNRTTIA